MGWDSKAVVHIQAFFFTRAGTWLVSDVDDLLIGGTPEDLQWVRESIEKKYPIKGTDIDSTKGGLKFLDRRMERQRDGFMWSADPKHRDVLLDEWGLANTNPVGTPDAAENDLDWIAREKDEEMTHNEATRFRRAAARLNFSALDRALVSMQKGSACTARPRVSDVQTLKRALRYLKGQPMWEIALFWQPVPVELVVLTDSDWAGYQVSRRIFFWDCRETWWTSTAFQQYLAKPSSVPRLADSRMRWE